MKSVLLAVALLGATSAWGAEFCQDIPDGIAYDEISNNFDGSVYFKTPKVFVGGTYMPLRYSNGFCTLVSKKKVAAEMAYASNSINSVELDDKGNLVNIYTDTRFIDWIVCK